MFIYLRGEKNSINEINSGYVDASSLLNRNIIIGIINAIVNDSANAFKINKKINSKIRVTMIHGKKDEVVPISSSKLMLSIFKRAQKKLIIVKGGDHSLSNDNHLKIILRELKSITKNVI